MDHEKRLYKIFVERVKKYLNSREECTVNAVNSPIYDLLNTGERFGHYKLFWK